MRKMLAIAAAAFVLAACGGGGGGGGSSVSVPVTNPTTAPQAKIQTAAAQRNVASQSLSAISGSQSAYQYGGGGSTSVSSVHRDIMSAARQAAAGWRVTQSLVSVQGTRQTNAVYSACSSGVESVAVTVSSTEVQLYERVFYDLACTALHEDIYLDVVATSYTAGNATGNVTFYNRTGTVYDYGTLSLTITGIGTGSGSFAIRVTDAPSASALQTDAVGVACNVSTSALGCGIGAAARVSSLGQDLGATMSLNISVTTNGTTVTVPVNGSATAYAAGLGTMALSQSTFPNWIVSPGSAIDSATFTGTLTLNSTNATVTALTFSLTDTADDATVTVSASGSPVSVAGVIKQADTGQTVATFTTDVAGNGTITYSNGATGQILNWAVLG